MTGISIQTIIQEEGAEGIVLVEDIAPKPGGCSRRQVQPPAF